MPSHRHCDGPQLLRPGAELVHVAPRHQRVPLGRRRQSVRQVVVAGDLTTGHRGGIRRHRLPRPRPRVAVPARRDQHVARDPGDHCGGSRLQRGHRRGPSHVDGRRVAQVLAPQVGCERFGASKIRKGHQAVDLTAVETGVLDGANGCLQLQAEQAHPRAGPAHVGRLSNPDDAGLILHRCCSLFT